MASSTASPRVEATGRMEAAMPGRRRTAPPPCTPPDSRRQLLELGEVPSGVGHAQRQPVRLSPNASTAQHRRLHVVIAMPVPTNILTTHRREGQARA